MSSPDPSSPSSSTAAPAPVPASAPGMPLHHDAYISDIVVVCDPTSGTSIDDVVRRLNETEMRIAAVDRDNCVIEGTVDAGKIHQIDDFPGVSYVRSVFTYVADYPAGDPRDQDKVTREW